MLLDSKGNVFTFGCNSNGQLGSGAASSYSWSPTQLSGLLFLVSADQLGIEPIAKISAGACHSLLLSEKGTGRTFVFRV